MCFAHVLSRDGTLLLEPRNVPISTWTETELHVYMYMLSTNSYGKAQLNIKRHKLVIIWGYMNGKQQNCRWMIFIQFWTNDCFKRSFLDLCIAFFFWFLCERLFDNLQADSHREWPWPTRLSRNEGSYCIVVLFWYLLAPPLLHLKIICCQPLAEHPQSVIVKGIVVSFYVYQKVMKLF